MDHSNINGNACLASSSSSFAWTLYFVSFILFGAICFAVGVCTASVDRLSKILERHALHQERQSKPVAALPMMPINEKRNHEMNGGGAQYMTANSIAMQQQQQQPQQHMSRSSNNNTMQPYYHQPPLLDYQKAQRPISMQQPTHRQLLVQSATDNDEFIDNTQLDTDYSEVASNPPSDAIEDEQQQVTRPRPMKSFGKAYVPTDLVEIDIASLRQNKLQKYPV